MGIPIGVQFRVIEKLEVKAVQDAVQKGAFKSLANAVASIRKSVRESFARVKGPSPPGTPPHRHKGRLFRSILFDVDKTTGTAVVGPSYDALKSGGLQPWVGSMHERGMTVSVKARKVKGKTIRAHKRVYPPRPYMAPAFQRALPRMAGFFANTITP